MPGEHTQSDPSPNLQFLVPIVDQLACPACMGGLRLGATELVCEGCSRVYPVVDGIPVLIAEQGEPGSTSGE